jgi:hypothetical protein
LDLIEGSLRPLYVRVRDNIDTLCEPLDTINAVSLRQHALPSFEAAVLARLSSYLAWLRTEAGRLWLDEIRKSTVELGAQPRISLPNSAASMAGPSIRDDQHARYLIGGVFAALLSREPLDGSIESQMVVDALRRSNSHLASASESELGEYLRGMTDVQLTGVASNIKGIYHELNFVRLYNENHEDTEAYLPDATNYPGADVFIRDLDTGQIVEKIQLKALTSVGGVHEHLERYRDIKAAVTSEVAKKIDHPQVVDSGFSNETMSEEVQEHFASLADHTVFNRVADTIIVSASVTSAQEIIQMMRGERQFPEAVLKVAARTGASAAATAMTAKLFG